MQIIYICAIEFLIAILLRHWKQVGKRPGDRCEMRPPWIINYTLSKKKHFRSWNVFDDICRMGRWSFRHWLDVNRSTFERQSARVSKITNDGLTRPGIGCFIAVPMWHHWASKNLWPMGNPMVTRPMTSSDPETSNSWPQYTRRAEYIANNWKGTLVTTGIYKIVCCEAVYGRLSWRQLGFLLNCQRA